MQQHPPVRIKICSITRGEDARAAINAGADAIGLIFDANSPRAVTLEQAVSIAQVAVPFVTVVGVFVDPKPDAVHHLIREVPLSLLQFHGSESAELCRSFGRPYIKAIRVWDGLDLAAEERRFDSAVGLLLDAFVPGKAGGAGVTFDWTCVPSIRTKPIVLAGGLTPLNVSTAIRSVRPSAVDVSNGVELSEGIKDREKIVAFVKAVRDTER